MPEDAISTASSAHRSDSPHAPPLGHRRAIGRVSTSSRRRGPGDPEKHCQAFLPGWRKFFCDRTRSGTSSTSGADWRRRVGTSGALYLQIGILLLVEDVERPIEDLELHVLGVGQIEQSVQTAVAHYFQTGSRMSTFHRREASRSPSRWRNGRLSIIGTVARVYPAGRPPSPQITIGRPKSTRRSSSLCSVDATARLLTDRDLEQAGGVSRQRAGDPG
jgi:hypothetical protein